MYFTHTLFTDILFIKSSRKTLQILWKHPIMVIRCVRRPCVTCGHVFFHFATFRIIMEIWDFCLEISLKNHWKFSRLVCGNPVVISSVHWQPFLTHSGRVTHICTGKLAMIGSDNGLSPGRRQAINNIFPRVQLTISHHWFRWWLGWCWKDGKTLSG